MSTAKTRILDDIIFQAMADITFFFGEVGAHPEIRIIFDDDIKELLGVKRMNPKDVPWGFMFITLVMGMLSTQFKSGKDFRLRLNELLHQIIWSKMAAYYLSIFKSRAIQGSIEQDYHRVMGWAEMLTYAADNEGEEYRIPVAVIRKKLLHQVSSKKNLSTNKRRNI